MKKFPVLIVVALFCAASASAQNNRYRFDNFDTSQGVRVQNVPTTDVLPSTTTTPPARSSRTSRRTATLAHGSATGQRRPVIHVMPNVRANAGGATSLGAFTTGNPTFDRYIAESGARNRVDPTLLYAIMHQESAFRPRAISRVGASGLMQLMPGTARRFGVTNIFDPRQNIEGGARYMRFLLDFFGNDIVLALAGYNAGEGAVLRYGRRVPPYRETQEYVRRISRRYEVLRDPQTLRRAQEVSSTVIAEINQTQQATPPTVYERNVFAVRRPDGTLQLVAQ